MYSPGYPVLFCLEKNIEKESSEVYIRMTLLICHVHGIIPSLFYFCFFEGKLSGFGGPYRPFFTIMEYFFRFSVVSVLSAFVSFVLFVYVFIIAVNILNVNKKKENNIKK